MRYKLESLRGIAACMVILFHSPFSFGYGKSEFFLNSYLFVDFFFVLSGYVMTLAYSARIKSGLNFKSYIILRLGRIYPLHLVMLFVWIPYILFKQYLFASGFGGTDQLDTNNLQTFLSNIFLTHSLGFHQDISWNRPSWSISVEFFTYIAFYVFTVAIDKKDSFVFPLVIICVSYGILISLGRESMDITYDYGFFRCIGAFYLGVLVFRISQVIKPDKILANNVLSFEIASFAAIVLSLSLIKYHPIFFASSLLSFGLAIYIFSNQTSGILGNMLLSKPFKKLGIWSYSIYMTHMLIIATLSNFFEFVLKWNIYGALGYKAFFFNAAIFLLTIAVSKYTHQFIETVFRDKSRQWVSN